MLPISATTITTNTTRAIAAAIAATTATIHVVVPHELRPPLSSVGDGGSTEYKL